MVRKRKAPQEFHSSVKRKQNISGVEFICKSQLNEEVYTKLLNSNKVRDFVACIEACSSSQYTIEKTCEVLENTFKFYIGKEGLSVDTFKNMLGLYEDICNAWGYGTGGTMIDLQKVRRKANEIITNLPTTGGDKYDPSKSMRAIEMYSKLYDKEYIKNLKGLDDGPVQGEEKITQVNIFNNRLSGD